MKFMTQFSRGSEWRKWDLHIHTPFSHTSEYEWSTDEEKWENFLKSLEDLPEDIKVIGINDYLFLDGYKEVLKYKKSGGLKNIDLILPVIEFRLKEFVGNTELKRINYHIIFADDSLISASQIESQFLNQLTGSCNLDATHPSSISWWGVVTRESLIDLWNQIYNSTPIEKRTAYKPFEIGFNNINYEFSKLIEVLGEWARPNTYLKDRYFKAIWKSEWESFRWDSCPGDKKTLINSADFIFSASPTVIAAISGKNWLIEQGVNSRLLHCSDAHNAPSGGWSTVPKDLGHCFTWIKADTTFEGLRQTVYEFNERVFIWENKPTENIHKISKIDLKFWDNITINRTEDKQPYDFCFSGVRQELLLSDYFNCFIWWRWSGKSSLLNLIYKRIEEKKTKFFDDNILKQWGWIFDIKTNIDVDHSSETVEFLGQNQIEEFATNYEKFSLAIYGRLDNQDDLQNERKILDEKIQALDGIIGFINQKKELEVKVAALQKNLSAFEKIVSIVKWIEYQDFQSKWKVEQDKLKRIRLSKENYLKLKNKFAIFLEDFQENAVPLNFYDASFNTFLVELRNIKLKMDGTDFTTEQWAEETTQEEYNKLSLGYANFLTLQGVSREKLSDISKAQEWIHELTVEIPKIEAQIADLRAKIDTLSFSDIKAQYEIYETCINAWLAKAQKELSKIKNDNIWEIELNISFDIERAKSDIFDNDFWNHFQYHKDKMKFVWDKVFETLYSVNPMEILNGSKTYQDLLKTVDSWNTNWHTFLQSVFSDEVNFQIYKIIIAKYFYSLHTYLKINILYNKRPIENSSFWQKCTVVILIMILFGTKPIIIDEPEAHLDSSLIADYLVDLIKQRKRERQIIFATHNANFVINGDAEQIFILETESNRTKFTQTTIEDLKNRDKLLRLEGWKTAFELRGIKYRSS